MGRGIESFERGKQLAEVDMMLQATTYNLARILLSDAGDCLFVPLRPLQYMAVVDEEEIIFIDGHDRRWVDVAWRRFRPQDRQSLGEPVSCLACYYRPGAEALQTRLPAELHQALALLYTRRTRPPGRVVALGRPPA